MPCADMRIPEKGYGIRIPQRGDGNRQMEEGDRETEEGDRVHFPLAGVHKKTILVYNPWPSCTQGPRLDLPPIPVVALYLPKCAQIRGFYPLMVEHPHIRPMGYPTACPWARAPQQGTPAQGIPAMGTLLCA